LDCLHVGSTRRRRGLVVPGRPGSINDSDSDSDRNAVTDTGTDHVLGDPDTDPDDIVGDPHTHQDDAKAHADNVLSNA
jgi:hypothetical protein